MFKFTSNIRRFDSDEFSLGLNIVLDKFDMGNGYKGGITIYLELVLWQVMLAVELFDKRRHRKL